MTTVVQFDDREQPLFDEFRGVQDMAQTRFDASLQRLPLGDIVLSHEELVIIVERKRHDDLMKSVYDGRLEEQTHRLEQWRETHGDTGWTVLLVEGAYPPQNVNRHRHFAPGPPPGPGRDRASRQGPAGVHPEPGRRAAQPGAADQQPPRVRPAPPHPHQNHPGDDDGLVARRHPRTVWPR